MSFLAAKTETIVVIASYLDDVAFGYSKALLSLLGVVVEGAYVVLLLATKVVDIVQTVGESGRVRVMLLHQLICQPAHLQTCIESAHQLGTCGT